MTTSRSPKIVTVSSVAHCIYREHPISLKIIHDSESEISLANSPVSRSIIMSDFPELTIPLFTPVDSTLDNIYLCHCAVCVFFHSFHSPAWGRLFINTAALRWVLLSAFGMLRGALPNGIGQVTR